MVERVDVVGVVKEEEGVVSAKIEEREREERSHREKEKRANTNKEKTTCPRPPPPTNAPLKVFKNIKFRNNSLSNDCKSDKELNFPNNFCKKKCEKLGCTTIFSNIAFPKIRPKNSYNGIALAERNERIVNDIKK